MRRGSGFEAVGLFVALPSAEESLSFQSLLPRPVRTGQRWNAASGALRQQGQPGGEDEGEDDGDDDMYGYFA